MGSLPEPAAILACCCCLLAAATAAAAPSTAASSTTAAAAAAAEATPPPSRAARASARVETVTGEVGAGPRPTLSRAAVLAAARAAVAARAVEAARLAGAAGARLALAAAAPALRAGSNTGATQLVLGPVGNASEPRCANVSSVHYSLDMLLGTWYVVEVLAPAAVATVCDGFELTRLNVSRAWQGLQAEAVILSRFGRRPGGPTAYFNRTVLVGGGARAPADGLRETSSAPMLYDQLAVTDYAPGGRYLSVTACHEGQHWTYVYGRRPAPAAPDELRAMHARLAAAGVDVSAPTAAPDPAADDAENDAGGRQEAAEAQTSTPPGQPASPTPEPPAVFNVTECGW